MKHIKEIDKILESPPSHLLLLNWILVLATLLFIYVGLTQIEYSNTERVKIENIQSGLLSFILPPNTDLSLEEKEQISVIENRTPEKKGTIKISGIVKNINYDTENKIQRVNIELASDYQEISSQTEYVYVEAAPKSLLARIQNLIK